MARGKYDIIYDMLLSLRAKPLSKTNMLNYSNTENTRSQQLFQDILVAGFITGKKDGNSYHYSLTSEGKEYIELYRRVKKLLGDMK